MAEIKRKANAAWSGDLVAGKGVFSTNSGTLVDIPYSFATRFESHPGSNPEELIAAAHAACYSMAFAAFLTQKNHRPERISTQATCSLIKANGGFKINHMLLEVTGSVPGLDNESFQSLAQEADKECPVSNLLCEGLTIEIIAALE